MSGYPMASPALRRGPAGGPTPTPTPTPAALAQYRAPTTPGLGLPASRRAAAGMGDLLGSPTAMANARLRDQLSQVRVSSAPACSRHPRRATRGARRASTQLRAHRRLAPAAHGAP
jgi:hypothetical protein